MRTRLDEIMDRIIKHWHDTNGSPVSLLREGVNDAFRHGVEQAKLGASVRDANVYGVSLIVPVFGDVQPAPATEKKPLHKEWCQRVYWVEPYNLIGHECDRRKGERRKEQWMQQLNTREGFKMKPWPAFDRRSGKDRRRAP